MMQFFQNDFSFLAASAISSSLENEFSILVFAIAGGLLVFIGLVIEKWADFINDRFEGGGHPPHKKLENVGWAILMVGIAIEIGDAGFAAIDSWETRQMAIKNDPLNQLVSDVSILATINLAGTNFFEYPYPYWGSPPVAYAELCDNRTNDGHMVMSGQIPPFFSTLGEFSELRAFDFKRINYLDATGSKVSGRGFIMRFSEQEFVGSGFRVSYPPKVVDIVKNLHVLKISAKFIQHDSELAGGEAYLTINGSIRMRFDILPQKALSERDGGWGGGFEPGFTLIATNGIIAPMSRDDIGK